MAKKLPSRNNSKILSLSAIILTLAAVFFVFAFKDNDKGKYQVSDTAFKLIEEILAFGPRYSGSEGLKNVQSFIKNYFEQEGFTVAEDDFIANTSIGKVPMKNISVLIPGQQKNSKKVLLCAHYESKLIEGMVFVGANDNASGTALLMALAPVLEQNKYNFDIEIVFFDGEESFSEHWEYEDSLFGSKHYVQNLKAKNESEKIKAMILLDMIGDSDFGIDIDSMSNERLTKLLIESANEENLSHALSGRIISVEDDHTPFLREGIPAIDIIDFSYGAWHTENDTIEFISPDSLKTTATILLRMLAVLNNETEK